MMLPKGLQKQLGKSLNKGFVVNRDIFSKALVIYPWKVWEQQNAEVNKLNRFVKKNVLFIRKFNSGATRIELDGQGRILIPAALMAYAETKKEVKLNALNDRIELWSKKNYEQMLKDDIDMGALAEEVMGDVDPDDE
jgi:MraZ protein